jgi:hypothetical protein
MLEASLSTIFYLLSSILDPRDPLPSSSTLSRRPESNWCLLLTRQSLFRLSYAGIVGQAANLRGSVSGPQAGDVCYKK